MLGGTVELALRVAPIKTCFVTLPAPVAMPLIESGALGPRGVSIVELRWTDWQLGRESVLHVGWDGSVAPAKESALLLSAQLCLDSRLADGQRVMASLCTGVGVALQVGVEPLSSNDWEILELNAGFLEGNILQQVAVCAVGQVYPLWVYGKVVVRLRVLTINGATSGVGQLVPDTEVIVAPKQRTAHARASPPQQSTQPLPMDARIVYPLLSHADDDQVPNALWVNGADFASLHWKEGLLMSVVNPYPITMSAAERQELPEPPFEAATRVVVRAYCSDDVPTGHVRVPAGCLHALQLRPLSQVQLIPWAGEPTKCVASVRLIVSASNKSFDWPAWIARQAPTHVLTSGSVLTVGAELVRVELLAAVPVTSQPAPPPLRATSVFGTLSAVSDGVVSASAVRSALGVGGGRDASASVREANADSVVLDDSACVLLSSLAGVACATVVRAVPVPRVDVALPEPSIDQLAAVQAPFEELSRHVDYCLALPQLRRQLPIGPGCAGALALVTGGLGTGKSALVGALARRAAVGLVYSETLDCTTLALERLSRVKSTLAAAFSRCLHNQPSLLVLEALHNLCPSVEGDDGGSSLRPLQMSACVSSLLRSVCDGSTRIAVVATAPSREVVHDALLDLALCGTAVSIPPLGRDARLQVIQALVRRFQLAVEEDEALPRMARLTDGFAVGDLVQLLHRTPHLNVAGVEAARAISTPHALQGLKLHHSNVRWSDIGGLDVAKATLKQTLEWPTLYARLFASSPIKLPTGLLLYGHTGTGKTLLANAAAAECGLNFFSVAGPELLSKYIGASEQAVRDVFRRANASKPAVILFDEFESLAPRRGHDSTGVTDRVVNQLLTQLDGVESRVGVFVIAVTSRPDLIDPALLRPGRLDKLLHVPMPSASERLSILRCICAKLTVGVAEDVDLAALAQRSEHFTGADLQALFYNAQLAAVHTAIETAHGSSKGKEEDAPAEEEALATAPEVVMWRGDGAPVGLADRAATMRALQPAFMHPTPSVSGAHAPTASCVVRQHHLDGIAEPSVSSADRAKYARIYSEFQGAQRDADFVSGPAEGERQTLM